MNRTLPLPSRFPLRRPGARLAAAAGLALLCAALLAACSGHAEPGDAPPPPEVSVAEVVARPVVEWDEYTGRVVAPETVELRPRVSGYVDRVAFEEGDEVRKGDLLFVIDPRPYRATLARAEAQLAQARSQAQLADAQNVRAGELVAVSAISREDFEARDAGASQARAAVRAAEAAVASARLDLQFTEVRSPIDGRAGRAMATAGNLATADLTSLTTVVSLDPVHVYFETDEQRYLHYQSLMRNGTRETDGNPVRVGLANERGHPHAGRVDFVDNRVDSGTGTIRARAVVPNPDRVFTPGLFARVQLAAGRQREALLIDDRAVLTDQDRKYVYVIGEGDTAQRRDIVPGRVVDGLRVVEEGLAPGDRIIVHGVQKVFMPGMPVRPVAVAMGDAPPAAAPAAAG
ncbi:efflux RND transporter periplasmic adaptor subunit [Luteimonas sp. Y-2-2-4F]|nr:efflux RND transporter periplasmic adaptor subunit [Luteimonas sp. Y-2-2-4F]MCD9032156.1 efflux RND transporter periplasmic adaptor subunit [Luteimonas sp. Y-2-2-4F]